MLYKNYYEASMLAYQNLSELPELYYNHRDSLFSRILAFNKASLELIFELFTYGYLNLLYPNLSLIELQRFPKDFKRAIKNFTRNYVCLRFFSISPEKDDETIYEAIHLVKINNITPKITI